MASPAVMVQVNGVAAPSRPASPASVNSTSTKRKRDATDDDDDGDIHSTPAPSSPKSAVNGLHPSPDSKSLVADFVRVLESHDTNNPSILRRPLPESPSDGEPSSKRAKSEDPSKPTSVADKVSQDAYNSLEDLVSDVLQAADAQVKDLEAAGASSDASLIAKTREFRGKALELFRREMAYPNVPRPASRSSSRSGQPSSSERLVLSAVGAAPTVRPLFTSLPKDAAKALANAPLPKGVTVAKVPADPPVSSKKSSRVPTLGELFPSPRNLPPLQPPKAPRTTTKSNVLTFYHPELEDKSNYRAGTYFTSQVLTGHWLDYSHATPTIHPKAKQRERAQSLAGVKPSSTELEMAELETLFRSAFSSFAPCKDDTGAIVPSGQVGRIWWQRVGRRNFNRMVEAEEAEDEAVDVSADAAQTMEIDEERVKEVIDNWDPSLVDPGLDELLGKKQSDQEKEVDDLLEEVSDLIETLASYQRNRNLTLPTSQDRYSADPVNGDMLRNSNLAHQPSEEEMMTYEALKAQLALIIQNLPPYAVARLNSDRLADLAVSTKIEIRSDEYRGVMEEDEPARLARVSAQAAVANTQRQSHRAPAPGPYVNHQYQQFTPSARPVGPAQHFPQTPSRPQAMYPRAPSSVPMPQAHHQPVQPRPPATQFRPMYAPQMAKAQGPYGHANMQPQFSPAPQQGRIPPNYVQPGTPTHHRFAPGHQPGYPQHQQIQPHPAHGQPSPMPQHSPHPPPPMGHPQAPYSPYPNGAQMPRTMSPQVPQAHAYVQPQTPQPPPGQQTMARPPPGYGTPGPGMQPNAVPRPPYAPSPGPGMGMQPGGQAVGPAGAAPPPRGPGTPNLTGYATVMPEVQQRQVIEQAQAAAANQQQRGGHVGKEGVVGLAGIGLAGHMDVHKVAAAKMQQQQQQLLQQQQQQQQQMANHGHPGMVPGGPKVNGAVNSPRPIAAAPVPGQQPQHHQPQPMQIAPQPVGGQGK
ncbi:hypothetical protein VTJ49DRAFT_6018 [Mycothermus thermophilus]|uniref:Uncharacterized protein n=1 Tax=Humicola insolens TaxID=85995 RepID=A0ABR3V276_HUMIN